MDLTIINYNNMLCSFNNNDDDDDDVLPLHVYCLNLGRRHNEFKYIVVCSGVYMSRFILLFPIHYVLSLIEQL